MPPLGFAYPMLEALEAADAQAEKQTATHCLHWMQFLHEVFFQDAAAMLILYPERAKCSIFQLCLTQDEQFEVRPSFFPLLTVLFFF